MREELQIAGMVDGAQRLMTYTVHLLWNKKEDSELIYMYLTVSRLSQMMMLS